MFMPPGSLSAGMPVSVSLRHRDVGPGLRPMGDGSVTSSQGHIGCYLGNSQDGRVVLRAEWEPDNVP